MAAPSHSGFDLSCAESWHGTRPGMTRVEALAALEAGSVEVEEDPNDLEWLIVPDFGMELRFGEEKPNSLRQVSVDDADCHWNGKPLIGQNLGSVLQTLGKAIEGARWRPENAVDHAFDDLHSEPPGVYADETLLDEGSLWLPARQLALTFSHGLVQEVVWRRAEDVPVQWAGDVTPAQVELSRREDLADYLQSWRPQRRMSKFQRVLTGAFVLGLIFIAGLAVEEQQAWKNSPTAMSRVTAMEVDSDGFLVVEFTDKEGQRRASKVLKRDFFVTPAVGESVQVHDLSSNFLLRGPQVRGPKSVQETQDMAFTERIPWAIGLAALYWMGMTIESFLKRMRRAGPTSPLTPLPRTR